MRLRFSQTKCNIRKLQKSSTVIWRDIAIAQKATASVRPSHVQAGGNPEIFGEVDPRFLFDIGSILPDSEFPNVGARDTLK